MADKKEQKKKIIIILFSVVLFFVLLIAVLAFAFQDKIADVVLNQLYKQTKVEIKHEKVSFSLMRKFPMASLQVSDIEAKDLQGKNTLLKAEKITAQFNVFDLLRNNYTIRKIEISYADLHLIINEKGENNWNIFHTKDSVQSENVTLQLNMIRLQKVNVIFEHYPQKLTASVHFNRLDAKGDFAENVFVANLSSNAFIREISQNTTAYLSQQKIQFNTKLHIDADKAIYAVENGNFDLDILKFIANITLSKKGEMYAVETNLAIKSADIEKIIEKLPNEIHQKTAILKPKGIFSAIVEMNGELGKKNKLNISGNFECKNGSIENVENEIKLSKINMKGRFSTSVPKTLPTMKITVNDFSAKLNQGHIHGTLEVENFVQPLVNLTLNGKLNLEDLHNFLPTNYFHKTSGSAAVDLTFQNKFTQLEKITAQDFKHSVIQGNILFTNAQLQMHEDETMLENLSGNLRFDNQIVNTEKLKGKLKGNSFELNGKIENVLPYILDDGSRLQITASLYLPDFDIGKLFAKETQTSKKNSKEQQEQELFFPSNMDFDFTFKADKLSYDQFKAQNTVGKAIFSGNVLQLENLQINTCDGKILAHGTVNQQSNSNFLLKCEAKLSDINIQKLFFAFNNFGQKTLTDKNIRGTAHSNVTFSAVVQKNLNIIPHSVVSVVDIQIKNGELNNFSPLESLSKFVELDELRNVKFAALENQINIEKSTINIPAIEIKNNALNLSLWGMQSFSGDIDYHIKLLLQDVLAKKTKNKRKNEDFGEVIDDNTGKTYLHILATGNIDNPKFKWDSQSAQKGFRQQFSDQKRQIQEIKERNDASSTTPAIEKEKEKEKDKDLNNSKKKQREIEIGEDW